MNKRVLLVEDDPDARDSLGRSLARQGFDVKTEEGLTGALAQLETSAPWDAVVTDLCLGTEETGGIEVLRAARRMDRHLPVILITAFARVDSVKLALNEGASYLLEKPFRAAELIPLLGELLAGRSERGQEVEQALLQVGLTEKERSIAKMVLKGLTSTEIADLEGNSDKTIRQHITRIYAKCGVSSRAELFHFVFPW